MAEFVPEDRGRDSVRVDGPSGTATDDLLTERLLRVIDEGRRTATYKLALLTALINQAAANPGVDEIPTRALAGEVLDLYYTQAKPYPVVSGHISELRQITNKASRVMAAVAELRDASGGVRTARLRDLRAANDDAYRTALDVIEDTFVRYPIPLLQVVGSSVVPFLYHVDWDENTSITQLRNTGRDRVRLMDGVSRRLVVLGPLLRPLIELHWTADVARMSGIHTEDEVLRQHLFGTDRVAFPHGLTSAVAELQNGRCFYCGRPFTKRAELDHFIAWSRWPNDAIENLVAADRCNQRKSDHLAAAEHASNWAERNRSCDGDLASIANATGWLSDPARSQGLAVSTYGAIAPDTPLWLREREFALAAGPIRL